MITRMSEVVARIGIVGASGYTGAELLRLCAPHPHLRVGLATGDTQAGVPVSQLYPSLAAVYGDLAFTEYDPAAADDLDLVFLALPHGAAAVHRARPPQARSARSSTCPPTSACATPPPIPGGTGSEHSHPELLGEFAFGLPELFREDILGSALVAAPGCYVTAASLALAPLVRLGLIEREGVIVDAASGVSGAGRGLKATTSFCTVDEDFTAYGLLDHRHTPEIEQATGARVLFTPHLAPMNRGILATCYARPTGPTSTAELLAALTRFFAAEPFVVVTPASPSTKATLGSNTAHVTARYDERTGWVVVLSALDNLVKGASGQAVQCANLLLGLPETEGLPLVGVYP